MGAQGKGGAACVDQRRCGRLGWGEIVDVRWEVVMGPEAGELGDQVNILVFPGVRCRCPGALSFRVCPDLGVLTGTF